MSEAITVPLDTLNILSVVAGFSQAGILAITVFVLHKNLGLLKKQNYYTVNQFKFQTGIEKHTLTLKFASWIDNELKEYIPHINTDDETHPYMTKSEIRNHVQSIAKNLIDLIDQNIVHKTLLVDEIKKLHITLNSFKDNQIYVPRLKELLEECKYAHYPKDDTNDN